MQYPPAVMPICELTVNNCGERSQGYRDAEESLPSPADSPTGHRVDGPALGAIAHTPVRAKASPVQMRHDEYRVCDAKWQNLDRARRLVIEWTAQL
jgi:hypothetical protein